MELLVWSAVVSVVIVWIPEKLWLERRRIQAAALASENEIVRALERRAAGTRWIFTTDRIAAFWARIPIPPPLAVIPSKRHWSGQIDRAGVIAALGRYRPELIFLSEDAIGKFGISEYVREHYRADVNGALSNLYVRKSSN